MTSRFADTVRSRLETERRLRLGLASHIPVEFSDREQHIMSHYQHVIDIHGMSLNEALRLLSDDFAGKNMHENIPALPL